MDEKTKLVLMGIVLGGLGVFLWLKYARWMMNRQVRELVEKGIIP